MNGSKRGHKGASPVAADWEQLENQPCSETICLGRKMHAI
jgi:hypothetical protein